VLKHSFALAVVPVLLDASVYVHCAGTSVEMKTEADSINITGHPYSDKPRPYACTFCDKRFMLKTNLTRHRKRHSEEKWYSCTHCEQRFQSLSYLRSHMIVHSTECIETVQAARDQVRQKLGHSGERAFKCSVCGNNFCSQHTLLCTAEFTVETNRSNVVCATRHLVSVVIVMFT